MRIKLQCNAVTLFAHNPHSSKISSTEFSSTQKRKCRTDKLFTQNEQMCNQTALHATPQQITLSFTELHLKQCKLTDKKTFFFIFEDTVLWQFHCCRCTHLNILAQRHCRNYKECLTGAYIWVFDPDFEILKMLTLPFGKIMNFAHSKTPYTSAI